MARMMIGGLIIVLAAALAFHARAADKSAWQVSQWPGFVRYAVHGTVVHGHRFGFIKHRGRCDDDLLSLFWSSFDPRVHRFKGTK